MNEEIKELMLTIPQIIVAYDANPKGQHLYDDQRLQIAKTLYNAGYRKSSSYPIMTEFEVTAIMKEQLRPVVRELTIQEVDKAKISAVKEFADKVKEYINNKVISDFDDSDSVQYYTIDLDEFESEIDELLKEYDK